MAVKAPLLHDESAVEMRIGIVTETYPPEVNGVALMLASLTGGLADLGHAVTVIRPQRKGARDAGAPGVTIVPVPGAPLPAYPALRFGLPVLRRIRRVWEADSPDAVYIATEGPLGWAAARVAGELGVPVLSGYHTRFDEFASHYHLGFAGGWIGRWLKRFHNNTSGTLVPTEELRQSLVEKGYRNVTVLRRAVDTARFDPVHRDPGLRRTWGAGPDTPVVAYVGRIAPEKNLDLVVRAFDAFRSECPGARMLWVGDGPARAALEREHPGHIFAGMRHGEDLARHYASADVFLFPSLTETYGNVTLEAMASGLAVVAFDYGAAREFITSGTNGYLAPRDEAERFIGWARHLARHPEARDHLRANARRAVSRLSPRSVAEDFADLMRAAANRECRP